MTEPEPDAAPLSGEIVPRPVGPPTAMVPARRTRALDRARGWVATPAGRAAVAGAAGATASLAGGALVRAVGRQAARLAADRPVADQGPVLVLVPVVVEVSYTWITVVARDRGAPG